MLNSFNEYQRIILLGGKSELGLSILENLNVSKDVKVFFCGRNMSTFELPPSFKHSAHELLEIDFLNLTEAQTMINQIFIKQDVDLVIFAYSKFAYDIDHLNSEVLEQVLATNFLSQSILLNHVFARMSAQAHGQILVLSSAAGQRARNFNFVYGASKAGLDFFAQGLQKISRKQNVFITILRPGFVVTKMTHGLSPAPFATNRNVVAKIAVKALKAKKDIVYIPRILRYVVLGLKHLPERIFRIIDQN